MAIKFLCRLLSFTVLRSGILCSARRTFWALLRLCWLDALPLSTLWNTRLQPAHTCKFPVLLWWVVMARTKLWNWVRTFHKLHMLWWFWRHRQWLKANGTLVWRLLLRGLWSRAPHIYLSEFLLIALCLRLYLSSGEGTTWLRSCIAHLQLLDRLLPFTTFWSILSWYQAHSGGKGMILLVLSSLHFGSYLLSWALVQLFFTNESSSVWNKTMLGKDIFLVATFANLLALVFLLCSMCATKNTLK
jgi:hypothetical protein